MRRRAREVFLEQRAAARIPWADPPDWVLEQLKESLAAALKGAEAAGYIVPRDVVKAVHTV